MDDEIVPEMCIYILNLTFTKKKKTSLSALRSFLLLNLKEFTSDVSYLCSANNPNGLQKKIVF